MRIRVRSPVVSEITTRRYRTNRSAFLFAADSPESRPPLSTNADVLVTVLALGAVGGAGLLLAGLAFGFWLGRSLKASGERGASVDREAVATQGLASLQRHA